MACIAKATSPFCLVSALFVLLFIIPSSALTQGQIADICNDTIDPIFCTEFLKSDPRFASVDLPTLLGLTVNIGHSKASDGSNYLKSLIQRTTDPSLKERLSSCAEKYSSARRNYEFAQSSVSTKDYVNIFYAVSAAKAEASDCEEGSHGGPPLPPALSMRTKELAEERLLASDQALFGPGFNIADELISTYGSNTEAFWADFATSMVKMGNVKPLTGNQGDVRSNCRKVN